MDLSKCGLFDLDQRFPSSLAASILRGPEPRRSRELANMTEEQIDRVVKHLSEHLYFAIRLKGSEAHPPNAKELGFDSASVRTVLLTGLRAAGVTIHHDVAGASEEPPWA